MSIVWSASWINEYESPWSIFEKISCKNLVTRNEILRWMGSEEVRKIKTFVLGDAKRDLITLRGFDPDILKGELNYDLHVHNESVIKKILGPINYYKDNIHTWFPGQLKWCAECLKMGYHSWMHQFALVDKCPFHEIELQSTCPMCQIKIPFLISDAALGHPFTCKCGHQHADISHSNDDWDLKLDIQNDAIIKWLSGEIEQGGKRLLLHPQHTTINVINDPSVVYSKLFFADKNTGDRDYFFSQTFPKEVYAENKRVFRTVDRRIKNLLKGHNVCIRALQELRKPDDGPFPEICPYAYSYVFWKQSLLKLDHFYKEEQRGSDITSWTKGRLTITEFVEEEIETYLSNLVEYSNFKIIQNTKLVHWVINKVTAHICFNYFKEWLDISEQRAKELTIPSSEKMKEMKERSIPEMAYIFYPDMTVEFYYRHDNESTSEALTKQSHGQCPYEKEYHRTRLNSMKSYSPLRAAMIYYSNKTDENKRLRQYVYQYVLRLS
jgi:hypothetical protein